MMWPPSASLEAALLLKAKAAGVVGRSGGDCAALSPTTCPEETWERLQQEWHADHTLDLGYLLLQKEKEEEEEEERE